MIFLDLNSVVIYDEIWNLPQILGIFLEIFERYLDYLLGILHTVYYLPLLVSRDHVIKGQLISKGLFAILESKKRTKQFNHSIVRQKNKQIRSFVCFLEESSA